MWNEHNYNAEELKIVRELEYLLFMYNPGFWAMWHDNFDEYFKGTQNHDYWEKQEEIRKPRTRGQCFSQNDRRPRICELAK